MKKRHPPKAYEIVAAKSGLDGETGKRVRKRRRYIDRMADIRTEWQTYGQNDRHRQKGASEKTDIWGCADGKILIEL